MGYKFGNSSRTKLDTCHVDIQKTLELALSRTCVDFGVTEGHRPIERQRELYAQGRTKPGKIVTNIDGVNKKGNHNYSPSRAVDIYIWHDDHETRKKIAYDLVHLGYIAGLVESCNAELLEKGEINHVIRWGNNWDRDGIIAYDQSFDDTPHFEIVL